MCSLMTSASVRKATVRKEESLEGGSGAFSPFSSQQWKELVERRRVALLCFFVFVGLHMFVKFNRFVCGMYDS